MIMAIILAATAMAPGTYVGVASCVNSGCHGSTVPLNATHVLQNEYFTWLNADRHAQAYNVLFDARSARIVRNMKLQKHAYEEPSCLACHSTNVAPQRVSGRMDLEDGVQCENCHGPAGGWRNEHSSSGWTHAQSVDRGMTDLRDVPTRASLCLSCHLGDSKREVAHDLLASGHPVLQFELENYTATMPPHWNGGSEGARAWAVGEILAFDRALGNIERHAVSDDSDFACIDCHHNLANGMWRQERGWAGRPGVPQLNLEHWPAVRAILTRLPRTDVGPPTREPASIDATRRAVQALIRGVDRLKWSDDDVRSMMRALAASDDLLDLQSAEQTALSMQALASSLARRDPNLVSAATRQAIDALFAEVRNADEYDPRRFAEKLRALRAAL